jgi:orotidine-5'-phosphate decarboxylase
MPHPNNKLIFALDVDSARRALELFDQLRDVVGTFKIGMQLFTATGPDLVRRIITGGGRVFLDLKYHDIPNTAALAGVEATRLGVSIFNVHAAGGAEMLRRTAEAVANTAARENVPKPKVIAVTVLTSLDQDSLQQIGLDEEPQTLVLKRAQVAADCGLEGVVASPQEIQTIRQGITDPNFLIVTPGIRAVSSAANDQRRFTTAAEAIAAGADYIVVGRPILDATDPVKAAQSIVDQIGRTQLTASVS